MTPMQESTTDSITKSYIVCSTGRSGSSLLCKTLASLGDCGNPAEYFHPDSLLAELNSASEAAADCTDSPLQNARGTKCFGGEKKDAFYAYYLKVLEQGKTANGVFGVKIHWHHFKDLLVLARCHMEELKDKSDVEVTQYLFPNPSFIFISRQDLLRQAISTCIAFQTDIWGLNRKDREREKTSQEKQKKLWFDPLSIYRYKVGLAMANRAWERFFEKNELPFHALVYEDLVASYEPTIREIYAFLGLEFKSDKLTVPTKRQANIINERWVRYYSMIPEVILKYYSNMRVNTRKWLEYF